MAKKIQEWKSYGTWSDISIELEIIGIKGKKKYDVMKLIHRSIDIRSGYRSQTISDFYHDSLNQFITDDIKRNKKK